jgi:hypothetical protein
VTDRSLVVAVVAVVAVVLMMGMRCGHGRPAGGADPRARRDHAPAGQHPGDENRAHTACGCRVISADRCRGLINMSRAHPGHRRRVGLLLSRDCV